MARTNDKDGRPPKMGGQKPPTKTSRAKRTGYTSSRKAPGNVHKSPFPLPPGFEPPGYKNPPFWKIEKIVRRYRGKRSYLFLLWYAVLRLPEVDIKKLDIPFFLKLVQAWDKDAHRLLGIYNGLKDQIGTVKALACAQEIREFDQRWQLVHLEKKRREFLKERYGSHIPPRYFQSVNERRQKLNTAMKERRQVIGQRRQRAERARFIMREKERRRRQLQLEAENAARLEKQQSDAQKNTAEDDPGHNTSSDDNRHQSD